MIDQSIINIISVSTTCWDIFKDKKPTETSEIIEIGICTIDTSAVELLNHNTILIKPEKSKISKFCAKFTGITQKDIQDAMSFHNACSLLRTEFYSAERPWLSWSFAEKVLLDKQCKLSGEENPFSKLHIKFDTIFSILHGTNEHLSIQEACKFANVEYREYLYRASELSRNVAELYYSIIEAIKKGKQK